MADEVATGDLTTGEAMTGARPGGVHVLTADGGIVQVRHPVAADLAGVRRLLAELSWDSRRMRFFTSDRQAENETAERICAPHGSGYSALVAIRRGRVVGVAEGAVGDRPDAAEIAIVVADDMHRLGIGTLLLEELAAEARRAGLRWFTAHTLLQNTGIRRLLTRVGLPVHWHLSDDLVRAEIRLDLDFEQDEAYRDAVAGRSRRATVASMRPLLQPHSVAVIAAGLDRGGAGRRVLDALRRHRFTGRLAVVDTSPAPDRRRIGQTRVYRSVDALPWTPDLALVAVPAHQVPQVVEECGRRGTRSLVVCTEVARDTVPAVAECCLRFGMRLLGPGSAGVANPDRRVRLHAAAGPMHTAGTVGVAVDSGPAGLAMLAALARARVGISTLASPGPAPAGFPGVTAADLLAWWDADGRTRLAVVAAGPAGGSAAEHLAVRPGSRALPVLTLVPAGEGNPARTGTVTGDLDQLVATAALLACQPAPLGPRIAIVAADADLAGAARRSCAGAGLVAVPLGVQRRPWLRAAVPLTLARRQVGRVVAHDLADAVLIVLPRVPPGAATAALTRLEAGGRPLLAVSPDQHDAVTTRSFRNRSIPWYRDLDTAVGALAHARERSPTFGTGGQDGVGRETEGP